MLRNFRSTSKRLIHLVPELSKSSLWTEKGIEGLLSPKGFQIAWLDYQKYLTMNLSMLSIGTDLENKSAFEILVTTAKRSDRTSVFHYASQSHNNHLFFDQLIEPSQNQSQPSSKLVNELTSQFGSMEEFKIEFLDEADSLLGQGWVFLTENENKQFEIKSCNNEGTPYFYARNQSLEMNSMVEEQEFHHLQSLKENVSSGKKDFSMPILCCNVWEYAYLHDYGVNGRSDYLENWWASINWNVVNRRVFSPFREVSW